jgi:hypothetical protein
VVRVNGTNQHDCVSQFEVSREDAAEFGAGAPVDLCCCQMFNSVVRL